MLHHVSVGAADVERAALFYDAVLGALGYGRVMEFLPHALAYGETTPEFWVGQPHDQNAPSAGNGAHFSFIARSKIAVDDFHSTALAHGGKDNGAPGPRPDYGPDYYGAFVIDLDGNRIEATFLPLPKVAKPAKAKKPTKKVAQKAVKKAATKKTPVKKKTAKKKKKAKKR
jgi:catechol 2,3-dioxygenase-like lactoylglutathione lyase family enzyme